MDKLISMVYFVLINSEINYTIQSESEFYNVVSNYAKFLSQKIELWMFVPCKLVDGVWVVLEEPEQYKAWLELQKKGGYSLDLDCRIYQESKERCLFEGVEYNKQTNQLNDKKGLYIHFGQRFCEAYFEGGTEYLETIENLVKYKLKLTPTAQKQIGL